MPPETNPPATALPPAVPEMQAEFVELTSSQKDWMYWSALAMAGKNAQIPTAAD